MALSETGASLHANRLLPERGEVTTTLTITLHRPCREIRMLDRPVRPGLLDVEHGLKLEPLGPQQVRFVHWQATSGLLTPIFGGSSDDGPWGQFEAMHAALGGVVERGLPVSALPASHAEMAAGCRFEEQRPALRRTG